MQIIIFIMFLADGAVRVLGVGPRKDLRIAKSVRADFVFRGNLAPASGDP